MQKLWLSLLNKLVEGGVLCVQLVVNIAINILCAVVSCCIFKHVLNRAVDN